jgi:acetyltransferase-like isoleucine patch superfamily enzyme
VNSLNIFYKIVILKNIILFCIRKIIFDFEYANIFLINLDKYSTIEILKRNGAVIGKDCTVESGQTFHNCNKNYSNLSIGNNCYIGKNCLLDLKDKIEICNDVTIESKCTLLTHLDLSQSELSKKYIKSSKKTSVGCNSYIGSNSTILMGVGIGNNSYVLPGSVVITNVISETVVGGSPAVQIKDNIF